MRSAAPGEVDEEERGPVAHEQPRAVVVRRPVRRAGTRRRPPRAVPWRARARGSSPRERLDGSLASPSGWFVSPAHTPCSLTASQVPPESSSRPPRIRGGPAVEHGDRGRGPLEDLVAVGARRCSGSPATSRDATTRRHTRCSPYRAPGRPPIPASDRRCTPQWRVQGLPFAHANPYRAPWPPPSVWGCLLAAPGFAGVGQVDLAPQPEGADQQHQPRQEA